LTTAAGQAIPEGLAAALAGETTLAVLPEHDDGRYRSMLHLDEPLEYPDAAVIVATSGSTGTPKGVVLSARAIRASANATHARLGGPGSWVCALPPHYVAGLMTHARGIVGGGGTASCASDLHDLPAPLGRSYLSVVPAQLGGALDDGALAARLVAYDAILVGGSAVPQTLLRRARGRGLNVVVSYGMSETCGGCVYDGVPLDGVAVDIMAGRIELSGDVAFSGYRMQPALTAQTLRGRTVITHDRGAWDGHRLTVLGRDDDVVISGGVNVDLAQLQAVCDELWGVRDGRVVVFDVPDERWGARIVAATTGDVAYAEVRERLRDRVEPAAVPKELARLVGAGASVTGKIDRALLRAEFEAR
jgi:O-succinylbenzoic acid--CoA ligase